LLLLRFLSGSRRSGQVCVHRVPQGHTKARLSPGAAAVLHRILFQTKGGDIVSNNKGETLKNLMINLGIFFILAGSVAVKTDTLAFFLLGLILLAIQTFEFKAAQPKKLVMSEIILSVTVAVAAVSQLVMAASFRAPQVFMVIMLLGAVLVVVEAVRKYADL
jgi:hypothetical protein